MLALLSAALLLQSAGTAAPVQRPDSVRRAERAPVVADSGDSTRPRRERAARRIPVTDEHRRTAFDDAGARELLARARDARTRQDTTLLAYDATTYQRVSVGMGVRRLGRERLLYREEEATRVRWRRGEGAVVDVLGQREVAPAAEGRMRVQVDVGSGVGAIPYFPGQETLWVGGDVASVEVNDREPVHPLVAGAEAYYKYATGDSVIFRLATGRTITLRELRVRPRQPRWNLAVGSLWFDVANAQLVRAVYRLSVPMEIWDVVREVEEDEDDDVPAAVKAMLNPMRATVHAVTVEYGLQEGNFWLPRLQAFEAEAEVSFMRVPVRFEQKYEYRSVNGVLGELPAIADADSLWAARQRGDSLWRDSVRALPGPEREEAYAARRAARRAQCDTASTRTMYTTRADGAVRVLVRVPCDTTALAQSAALPPSIFDEGDALFDVKLRDELMAAALSLQAQADWAPQPPVVRYGFGDGLLRYNRVEGLSPAVAVDVTLGRGYTAQALARVGLADWQPNAELALARSDGRRTLQVGAYRRLAAVNDWGDALGFGNSLSAFLFGRDDGFYYRSWGAELTGEGRPVGSAGGTFSWRLFSERHDAAERRTNASLAHWMSGVDFDENIAAREGSVTGLGARWVHTAGLDPSGLRLLTDVRGEGGVGSFTYGRALADLTVSHPVLPELVDGALTLSGGSSLGEVPLQRQFFLGGPHSIRGQDAGAMVGDAYWMARAELGTTAVGFRPVLFYDLGWAGPRGDWKSPGTPASGAGLGASILDGMLRFDVARGIRPERQWRVDFYLEARF